MDLAAALEAKDPSNRYVTTVPTNTGVVQVVGGGGGPVMLVAMSDPGSEGGRSPPYVGVWQGAGTTRYYAGTAAPAYTTSRRPAPAGATFPQ